MKPTIYNRRRRGISGLLQVAMIVGIVIIFAGILFVFAGEIFTVQTITDSIAMQKIHMQKVGNETFVSANVKNTGNHEITSVSIQVMIDADPDTAGVQPFTTQVSPAPLEPGITGSAYEKLVDSDGDDIALSTGQEVAIVLRATAVDGSSLTEPVSVRVR